jgi:phage-related tail fiber protein
LQTIDGIALAAGDRVLVKNQTSNPENGIYNAAVGAWTRAVDADASNEFADGCVVNVRQGTLNAGKRYQLSISTPFTLGTSAQTWVASEFPDSALEFTFTIRALRQPISRPGSRATRRRCRSIAPST